MARVPSHWGRGRAVRALCQGSLVPHRKHHCRADLALCERQQWCRTAFYKSRKLRLHWESTVVSTLQEGGANRVEQKVTVSLCVRVTWQWGNRSSILPKKCILTISKAASQRAHGAISPYLGWILCIQFFDDLCIFTWSVFNWGSWFLTVLRQAQKSGDLSNCSTLH